MAVGTPKQKKPTCEDLELAVGLPGLLLDSDDLDALREERRLAAGEPIEGENEVHWSEGA